MKSGLDGIKFIEDLNLKDKKVFIRLDLNVPMQDGVITDDTRIVEAIKTIKYALSHNARIILSSHLGRPHGDTPEERAKFSMLPVAEKLQELLGVEVILFDDPSGEGAKGLLWELDKKRIMLLENSRFTAGEEKNSMDLAVSLSSLTEVYITDAFGALHRSHATVVALPSLIIEKGVGYLIKKEIEIYDRLTHDIKRPFWAVLGGAKVSDKIGVIEKLLEKVDGFVIGGAMAYTFLAAQKIPVGKSLVEKDKILLALDILRRLHAKGKKIILPIDHVVAKELKIGAQTAIRQRNIFEDEMGLDIGPQTIELIRNELKNAKTIFWNGPMGAFEIEPFEKGTYAVAAIISEIVGTTVVGGGDSVSAVKKAGLAEKFTHVSTGGGASLEYLEGIKLPGLEIMKKAPSPVIANQGIKP